MRAVVGFRAVCAGQRNSAPMSSYLPETHRPPVRACSRWLGALRSQWQVGAQPPGGVGKRGPQRRLAGHRKPPRNGYVAGRAVECRAGDRPLIGDGLPVVCSSATWSVSAAGPGSSELGADLRGRPTGSCGVGDGQSQPLARSASDRRSDASASGWPWGWAQYVAPVAAGGACGALSARRRWEPLRV